MIEATTSMSSTRMMTEMITMTDTSRMTVSLIDLDMMTDVALTFLERQSTMATIITDLMIVNSITTTTGTIHEAGTDTTIGTSGLLTDTTTIGEGTGNTTDAHTIPGDSTTTDQRTQIIILVKTTTTETLIRISLQSRAPRKKHRPCPNISST
jgi:hypothetical protein